MLWPTRRGSPGSATAALPSLQRDIRLLWPFLQLPFLINHLTSFECQCLSYWDPKRIGTSSVQNTITFHRTYQYSPVFLKFIRKAWIFKNAIVGRDQKENTDKFKIAAADWIATYNSCVCTVAKHVWTSVHNARWYCGNTALNSSFSICAYFQVLFCCKRNFLGKTLLLTNFLG